MQAYGTACRRTVTNVTLFFQKIFEGVPFGTACKLRTRHFYWAGCFLFDNNNIDVKKNDSFHHFHSMGKQFGSSIQLATMKRKTPGSFG